jgi:hypothetical protein
MSGMRRIPPGSRRVGKFLKFARTSVSRGGDVYNA